MIPYILPTIKMQVIVVDKSSFSLPEIYHADVKITLKEENYSKTVEQIAASKYGMEGNHRCIKKRYHSYSTKGRKVIIQTCQKGGNVSDRLFNLNHPTYYVSNSR